MTADATSLRKTTKEGVKKNRLSNNEARYFVGKKNKTEHPSYFVLSILQAFERAFDGCNPTGSLREKQLKTEVKIFLVEKYSADHLRYFRDFPYCGLMVAISIAAIQLVVFEKITSKRKHQ